MKTNIIDPDFHKGSLTAWQNMFTGNTLELVVKLSLFGHYHDAVNFYTKMKRYVNILNLNGWIFDH